jgi:mono/diheme cytochrome c family protein
VKWSGIALGAVTGVALAALAYVYVASESIIERRFPLPPSHLQASMDAAAIARGGRLVQGYGCTDCHGKDLHGAFIEDFAMTSRNLTRLAKDFSDTDFQHAIRAGLRPDGTSVAETMPSDAFQYMPDKDLADIVGYIRSLPAAGDPVPEPSYGLKARYDLLSGGGKTDVMWFASQKPALDLGPKYARGRQLAMTACGECHTTTLQGAMPPGAGQPPDLSIVAAYDRGDFFKLMRTGKAAGNREAGLMSLTARKRFSHFSDDELAAIYDYLAARGQKLTK